MSKINIIVAVSNNMVIGKGNDLPWHLPSDLKNFKRITDGSCVIMGRKCWESIPVKFRPLPNRLNVVISRNQSFDAVGAATLNNLERTLSMFKNNGEDDEVFVIGGNQIYKEAFKFADELYLTRILSDIDGDVFLEGLNIDEWELVVDSDEEFLNVILSENGLKFVFEKYLKKTK